MKVTLAVEPVYYFFVVVVDLKELMPEEALIPTVKLCLDAILMKVHPIESEHEKQYHA